jgi:AAA domain
MSAELDTRLGGLVTPIDWVAFWNAEPSLNDWAIEPLLPAGRQVAVWSRAKVGKSLLALDVSAACATGNSVLGGPAVEATDVIYVDLEMGPDDLRDRLEDLGYGPETHLDRLHYYQGPGMPPLDTDFGGEVLMSIVAERKARVVVIDTMARAVSGEENWADTYRDFFRYTGQRLRAVGASVLRLDHGGKDRNQGQRGSSAKDDDVDVVLELFEQNGQIVLKRTRSRIAWMPPEVRLVRETEPYLRHVLAPTAVPESVLAVTKLLDAAGVPLDATVRGAQDALRRAGNARRISVVGSALKHRRIRESSEAHERQVRDNGNVAG